MLPAPFARSAAAAISCRMTPEVSRPATTSPNVVVTAGSTVVSANEVAQQLRLSSSATRGSRVAAATRSRSASSSGVDPPDAGRRPLSLATASSLAATISASIARMLGARNENAEVVFICVPTPYHEAGGLNCTAVWDAVDKLTQPKTVIIKSTVNPGTTDKLQEKYPQHTFFFVPEFLSEKTAYEDYATPRRSHIVGIPEKILLDGCKDTPESLNLLPFAWGTHPSHYITLGDPLYETPKFMYGVDVRLFDARNAEVLKLATNAFYAFKVTYANMLYDIGFTQESLNALGADPWIGNSHFTVDHKGYRGFGGKCLPKDTKALLDYAIQQNQHKLGYMLELMLTYNDRLKNNEAKLSDTNTEG